MVGLGLNPALMVSTCRSDLKYANRHTAIQRSGIRISEIAVFCILYEYNTCPWLGVEDRPQDPPTTNHHYSRCNRMPEEGSGQPVIGYCRIKQVQGDCKESMIRANSLYRVVDFHWRQLVKL